MELYDISKCVFMRVFKKFLKVVRAGKNGVKWGKKLGLESPFIHYSCKGKVTHLHTYHNIIVMHNFNRETYQPKYQ